ncbi:MAG: ATP-binding cassette domain-containing protein [Streptosporangiales bacterium]|nr:ATP-binding cassette domain-containing protein [Streptosporangiales bacterium]
MADRAEAPPAIEVRSLRKTYGRSVALHDVSLTVEPGEIFGFLGPNGAGKTTTVKILVGLARQTGGQAQIFGRAPSHLAARRRIGYLPEHFRFQEWATGYEMLDFHGRLAGMDAAERRERIPQVLEQVGLAGRGGEAIRRYSKGMTQRIGLAQAILHRPDLVLLDEPTSALDPVGRREVRLLVRALADDGVTVFLNSHLLTEVEAVCDRVAIVDRGRLVRAGRLSDLAGAAVQLRLLMDRVDRELLAKLAQHGEVAEVEGTAVTLTVDSVDVAPTVAETLIGSGYRLYGLVPVQPSLEDVFVGLVEGGDG